MRARAIRVKDSIPARILATLVLMGGSSLLLLSMVEFTANATHRHMEELSSTLFPASMRLAQMEASFEQMKKRDSDAVLLEEPAALNGADKDADAVASQLSSLGYTVEQSPELAARVDDLSAQFASIRSRSRETYAALVASKENVSDDLQARVAALARDNNRLTAAMQDLDGLLAAQGREEFRATEVWSRRSRTAGWVMLAVGLCGFLATWWELQFRIFQPLDCLGERMRDIAQGDGDLTGRLDVHGHSELDEVGRWFNVFIERIEAIVARVSGVANTLAAASSDLAQAARESVNQVALQHTEGDRITGSMEEISSAAVAIRETTQQAAQEASSAEQKAQAGGKTIQSTVATIQQLLAANQATATRIEELGRASDAIGAITGVIDEIADQTSMLALNASIEAARAGEHGRGFAVVATEVRRLAEHTSRSTREIDRTVRDLQAGTAETIQAMRSSMRHVETGVGSARSAGDALTSIIQGSEEVQRMVTQIAIASAQQSDSTQSINAALIRIAGIRARVLVGAEDAATGCDHLSLLAADLNQLVGAFKVRDTPPDSAGEEAPAIASPAMHQQPAIDNSASLADAEL
jgi:methyl-accepting chemotaxis protein